MLTNIRMVLVAASHPGNIGAAARAMKNMCLGNLVLVAPERFPHAEASARAAGADDVLASAKICATLQEAVGDCALVIGATARSRTMAWPQIPVRELGDRVLREAAQGQVAVVFGNEQAGLSNADLEHCHAMVSVPSNPDFSSLNLGAAVQVIAYEIYQAALAGAPAEEPDAEADAPRRWVKAEDMEGFYTHLAEALGAVGFFDVGNPKIVMRRLRRLFNRTRLDEQEHNILRGFFRAVLSKVSP